MQLTIVIPVFNEEANLPELLRRLTQVFSDLPEVDWRVLFVDDGSRDRTVSLILEAQASQPRIELLELSRNFGHQAAITAGLHHARGDAVVVMDGDLQDPPEVIPRMIDQWRQGCQVVRARRTSRRDTGLRRVGMTVFHRLMAMSRHLRDAAGMGVFVLLDRQAVDAVNRLPEQNRFLPGLWSWVGFGVGEVGYEREARAAGEAKQSLLALVRYALDAHFSFSYRLLRLTTWLGFAVSCCGFIVAFGFAMRRLLGYEIAQIGFTTLIIGILCLGGVQLIALGILGEYVGRIYEEVKRRPLFLVRRLHRPGDDGHPSQASDAGGGA